MSRAGIGNTLRPAGHRRLVLAATVLAWLVPAAATSRQEREITFTVVYDNTSVDGDLQADWGFACLVTGKELNVLFDTGTRSDVLLANLEKSLPVRDESVQNVLMFNLLEHVYNFESLSREAYRVLQKGGNCYIFVPFLHRIHEDPNDYFRYSAQALSRFLKEAGFEKVEVESLGFGPFTTACHFLPFQIPNLVLYPVLMTMNQPMEVIQSPSCMFL